MDRDHFVSEITIELVRWRWGAGNFCAGDRRPGVTVKFDNNGRFLLSDLSAKGLATEGVGDHFLLLTGRV